MTTMTKHDVDLGTDRDYGVVIKPDTIRFERVLPGPVERVWSYFTEPDKLGKWLATPDSEMRVGASVVFTWNHSKLSPHKETTPERYEKYQGATSLWRVMRLEPPRLVSWIWNVGTEGESEVTVELTSLSDDVLLVLTHGQIRKPEAVPEAAAGWHAHLAILSDSLAGRVPRPFWATNTAAQEEYAQRLGPIVSRR